MLTLASSLHRMVKKQNALACTTLMYSCYSLLLWYPYGCVYLFGSRKEKKEK